MQFHVPYISTTIAEFTEFIILKIERIFFKQSTLLYIYTRGDIQINLRTRVVQITLLRVVRYFGKK